MLDLWLDLMILKVFSNLNDSVILNHSSTLKMTDSTKTFPYVSDECFSSLYQKEDEGSWMKP